MQSAAELGKLLVLSPHLDDAVFACGELLASSPGAVSLTLFAGVPPLAQALTEWDRSSGFASGEEAISRRRDEDRRALTVLGATPRWLDFLDSQYRDSPSIVGLADIVTDMLEEQQPDTVLLPAGLFHSDHILAHQAALTVRAQYPNKRWVMYEEPMYRRVPAELQERLTSLVHFGIEATPLAFDTAAAAARKREAVQCYASQLQALMTPSRPGHDDVFAPEGYWQLDTATLTV